MNIRRMILLLTAGLLLLSFQNTLIGKEESIQEKIIITSPEEAGTAIKAFRNKYNGKEDYPAVQEFNRIEALNELKKVRHPLVLDELLKTLKEKNPFVKEEVIKAMGEMVFDKKKTGSALKKELVRAKEENVLFAILYALKKVKYRGAYNNLVRLLEHKEDLVAIETIRVLGEMKEVRAMKKFLPIFEANENEKESIVVRVSGNRGAERARSKYFGLKKMMRMRRRELLEALRKSMEQIAGVKIETLDELRNWIKKNKSQIKKAEMKKW